MNWENRPDFEDSFEKYKAKEHKTFGGKVVEILYGAKDADGNPTEPKDVAVDGHGRWYGIEVNGRYCMFAWRKPASEGGETVYSTEYKEDAVDVMETELRRKRDLCKEADQIVKSEKDQDENLAAIKAEWAKMTDWETPKDKECNDWMEKSLAAYDAKVQARDEAKAAKQELLDQAEALKESTSWKETGAKLKELRDAINGIKAGEAVDSFFRNAMKEVEDYFYARRNEFRATQGERRAASKATKEALIEETKGLLQNVKNWKAVGDKMNELFDQWKAAGSSGREHDDALWAEFRELRNQFFSGRRTFFEERNAQWNASKEKKRALIEEAKQITSTEDYGHDNTERMKELDKEWKTAGFSGKADNDRLWDEFTEAKEAFWEAKRGAMNKRSEAALERKETLAETLKKEIEDLELRITYTTRLEDKYDMENQIDTKKEKLSSLQADIASIRERLNK